MCVQVCGDEMDVALETVMHSFFSKDTMRHRQAAHIRSCLEVRYSNHTPSLTPGFFCQSDMTPEEFIRHYPVGSEDGDDWLNGAAALEKELQEREIERASTHDRDRMWRCPEIDPNELATTFSNFVGAVSSHEGAEVPQGQHITSPDVSRTAITGPV